MLLDDWRRKVHEIAEAIGISKEHVQYILHEELDMKSFAQDGCRTCPQQNKSALA
jgi:energy-converting hydrogenase A subunit M